MVTDSKPPAMTPSQTGFLARIGDRLRQFACGLHGHDEFLHFGKDRLSLQCVSCGHESPGWDVKYRAASADVAAAAPRARVIRMPLVDERRVA